MQNSIYEDYKYTMQDTGNIYIGTKYTLGEIIENEEITFKFRMLLERNILPEADREYTLESHLYYLPETGFNLKIYKQLKARVKVSVIEEKKKFFGKKQKKYVTKVLKIEELAGIPVAEKKRNGMIVQELLISKLALMSF
ncbi:MAG: hypothetical protein IKL04_09780 [Lachnospiraceae bacterium]|nr:hypothetical protein [Lachnospiraceae bacterium]